MNNTLNLLRLTSIFRGKTPWTDCGQYWNSECCSNVFDNVTHKLIMPENCTGTPRFPEQEYWQNRVLNITSGIEETGSINWEIVGCLAIMWTVTYACIYKVIGNILVSKNYFFLLKF